jgi:hypothetical protein
MTIPDVHQLHLILTDLNTFPARVITGQFEHDGTDCLFTAIIYKTREGSQRITKEFKEKDFNAVSTNALLGKAIFIETDDFYRITTRDFNKATTCIIYIKVSENIN